MAWPRTGPIILASFVAFWLCYLPGLFLAGPEVCHDGWHSASIGRQGACSHHGGVGGNWKRSLAFFGSLGVAGSVGYGLYRGYRPSGQTGNVGPDAETPISRVALLPNLAAPMTATTTSLPDPLEDSCPDCGARMVQRVAKRGSRKGQAFLGCPRYPSCRGIRALPIAVRSSETA
jgi:hypothetical protein